MRFSNSGGPCFNCNRLSNSCNHTRSRTDANNGPACGVPWAGRQRENVGHATGYETTQPACPQGSRQNVQGCKLN